MIIIGIDPGVATIGWGALKKSKNDLELIDYGVIVTSPKQTTGERLLKLYKEISALIKRLKPDVLVVEKLFFFKNLKTAMPVSEARGVILLAAANQKIKVIELTPLQIKMGVCGYGRADKQQVQKMVKEILDLEKIPKPDDAADAIAAALCGAYSLKNRSC
ncbi:MAG: crossover junction endodeoxyribonuclease RuvC [bacterium]|nr:crossover junction endodeoxyribonuclease RuvC [bacterium]